MTISFTGLRTIVYPVENLEQTKAWWTALLGLEPYFDEPFYVGFSINGYELALDPSGRSESGDGPVVYWGVLDVEQALETINAAGAVTHAPIVDYGGGIRTAVAKSPDGSLIGVIENSHFPNRPTV